MTHNVEAGQVRDAWLPGYIATVLVLAVDEHAGKAYVMPMGSGYYAGVGELWILLENFIE